MRATPLPESLLALLPRPDGGPRLWLVGGAVRDWLLERPILDLDFVVEGDALAMARRVADGLHAAFYALDPERKTGRVLLQDPNEGRTIYDFASLRAADILADLRERDFTVNAMAIEPFDPGRLIDPTGGLRDLKEQRLRACSDRSFAADPVRVLRAIRLAHLLEFRIEQGTLSLLKESIPGVRQVSPERMRDELLRILGLGEPSGALRMLFHLGILKQVLPELVDQADPAGIERALRALRHTAEILAVLGPIHDEERAADAILGSLAWRLGRYRKPLEAYLRGELVADRSRRPLLFLAGLHHVAVCGDLGSGDAPVACRGEESIVLATHRLRLSRRERQFLLRLLPATHELERGIEPEPLAVYRYYRQALDAGVGAILLELGAELAKQPGPPAGDTWDSTLARARVLLEAAFERENELIHPPPLVDGTVLQSELGIEPGPELGRLLEGLREAQVEGRIQSKEQALELARRWRQRTD